MRFKEYKEGGIDPDYYNRLSEIESNNNSQARSKTSSASGKFQFIKSTWEGLVKKHGLPYTLEDRFDPEKSKKVAELYTQENANYLKSKLGINPNNTDLYAAHLMGIGGASKFLSTLKKNPNASAYDVATSAQINANKPIFLRKDGTVKTAKEVYDTLNYKVTKIKSANTYNGKEGNIQQSDPYRFEEYKGTDYYAPRVSQDVSSLENAQKMANLAQEKSDRATEIKNQLDQKKAEREFMQGMIKSTQVAYIEPEAVQPTFEEPQQEQMFQQGGTKFLQPNDPKLPRTYSQVTGDYNSEVAMSIGGENGEPSYLIPSFKQGKRLENPQQEFRDSGEMLGGPFETWQEADKWEREVRHPAVEQGRPIPPFFKYWGDKYQQGGKIPVSSEGMYQYPNQEVLVPTNGAITMKQIPHDILGISQETGQQILMEPEQEYFFPNTQNVLEIPQTKSRIKTKRFSK